MPGGNTEIPTLPILQEQLKKWEDEFAKNKLKLEKLELESKLKLTENEKLVNEKQLSDLQLHLQELRDTMIEYFY